MSRILEEDFEYIISSLSKWKALENSTILVTGATGFIGSLIIKTLNYIDKKLNLGIKIIAQIRDTEKADEILKDCNVSYLEADLCNSFDIYENIDYIFHCAAITKSMEMIEKPVEVIEGIVNGTQNIMKLAFKKHIKSIVYLSSMEVYGQTNPGLEHVSEEDIGYIDIQKTRSSYPLGKRMAENICFSYNEEYKVPVKIARLAQTFGAGILKSETRVFSQFARSSMEKTDIILHTDGSSTGNYCYIADALAALILILLHGENGEIYNVSNESTCMTIRQMAELVAEKISNNRISVKFEIPDDNGFGYAAPVKMKLSSAKLRKLGWNPRYDMVEMYQRMIEYMKEEQYK